MNIGQKKFSSFEDDSSSSKYAAKHANTAYKYPLHVGINPNHIGHNFWDRKVETRPIDIATSFA
jgi:hypothetical protein